MRLKGVGNFLVAAGLLAGLGFAQPVQKVAATTPAPSVSTSDADLAKHVRHELVTYPQLSIWDDVSFRVNNGQVEVLGAVTQPYKKSDIDHIVKHVPGVVSLSDQLQ